jgi:transcriptional regulator with XRE-family HTH domain
VRGTSVPIDIRKIASLRTEMKLSQKDAAILAGLSSQQHWANIERGKHGVTVRTLEKIAKALGVTARHLLKDEAPTPRKGKARKG